MKSVAPSFCSGMGAMPFQGFDRLMKLVGMIKIKLQLCCHIHHQKMLFKLQKM